MNTLSTVERFVKTAADAQKIGNIGADDNDPRKSKKHSIFYRMVEIDSRGGYVCPPRILVTQNFELTEMDMASVKKMLGNPEHKGTVVSHTIEGNTLSLTLMSAYALKQMGLLIRHLIETYGGTKSWITTSQPTLIANLSDSELEFAEKIMGKVGLGIAITHDRATITYRPNKASKAA